MNKGNKEKMKKLGLILVFHWLVMPVAIIIIIIDAIINNKHSPLYHFLGFIIGVLWMFIFGRIYTNKISKLKQEMDANKYKEHSSKAQRRAQSSPCWA